MNENLISEIHQKIHSAERILIVSHQRPDGDAIGSTLGLGLALQEIEKKADMVIVDGAPTTFKFLSGIDQIKKKAEGQYDLIISLDCADQERIGGALDGYSQVDVNIDHHISNTNFANLNLVEVDSVATAEILAENLPGLGLGLTLPVAEAFLSGLLADSQGFSTLNMNSRALRVAADLVDTGADLPKLYARVLVDRSIEAVRYWGAGLSHLNFKNRIVWTSLSLKDRKIADYTGRDDADLITLLSTLSGFDGAVIFIEQDSDKVKVSWRSQKGFDVSQIAAQFGGGGHAAASGAMVSGTLEEVEAHVIETTSNAFLKVSL